ncbi:N-acyl homoserine lactonase family protein [Oryzihumus sp.]|uniref:N-acyl homoserine lactonase family protein n=1 Tax=Oryzihumus sp. TaxID=1968903 RepID=UPI002EDB84DE
MAVRVSDIHRVHHGTFTRPRAETGTEHPRVEVVLGYAVRHPEGVILFDTGIGAADAETDAWYEPSRVPLPQALAGAGLGIEDVDLVVNCHLHFDHCGGNPALAGRPVFVQGHELATARAGDYTVPELVDFAGVRYEELDGEAEIAPGVLVVPTPGHTEGHQALVLRCADGTVVLAGQSTETTSELATAFRQVGAARDTGRHDLAPAPAWVSRLLELDPRRVVLAHDEAVWEPA